MSEVEGHKSRFFFLHCLLFVVSKTDHFGMMDRSPDTASPAQAAPPAPAQAATPVVVLTSGVGIEKFYGHRSSRRISERLGMPSQPFRPNGGLM